MSPEEQYPAHTSDFVEIHSNPPRLVTMITNKSIDQYLHLLEWQHGGISEQELRALTAAHRTDTCKLAVLRNFLEFHEVSRDAKGKASRSKANTDRGHVVEDRLEGILLGEQVWNRTGRELPEELDDCDKIQSSVLHIATMRVSQQIADQHSIYCMLLDAAKQHCIKRQYIGMYAKVHVDSPHMEALEQQDFAFSRKMDPTGEYSWMYWSQLMNAY